MKTRRAAAVLSAAAVALMTACGGNAGTQPQTTAAHAVAAETAAAQTTAAQTTAEQSAAPQVETAADATSEKVSGEEQSGADPMSIYEEIAENTELPEMILADDDFISNYYGVDPGSLESYVFALADSPILSDSVVIMKAKEGADTEALSDILLLVKEGKEAEMDNYAPEAYDVAKDGRIFSAGRYVCLVMSPEADQIEKLISDRIS